jgi:hypothetical protein
VTEQERQDQITNAIHYWMPDSWPESGQRYTLVSFTFTGDVESGGIDVEVSKDGTASAVIQFTNDECYGPSPLAPATAKQRVYDGSYS